MKIALSLLSLLVSSVIAVPTGGVDPEPRSHLNNELTEVTSQTTEPSTIQFRALVMEGSEMSPSPRSCADEYYYDRMEEFNLVDGLKVRNSLTSLTPEQYRCVEPSEPRVLLRDQRLSSAFQGTLRVNDWCLYNGCVVQSFTVPYRATFATDCSSSSECIVNVPCVVPKMVIRYDYEFCAEGGNSTGSVNWGMSTEAIAILVRISKNANRSCEILPAVEKSTRQANMSVCVQDHPDEKQIVRGIFLNSPSALQTFIVDEIKLFSIRVVQEAFSQSNNVFSPVEEVHRFCDRLVVPGELNTSSHPVKRVPGEPDTPSPPVKRVPGDPDTPSPPVKRVSGEPDTPSPPVKRVPGEPDTPSPPVKRVPGDPDTPSPPVKRVPGEHDTPSPPVKRVPGDPDTPSPSLNITPSASADRENHQIARLTTNTKNNTDTINLTVNVNINMTPSKSTAPSFNREKVLQFLQLLKSLNSTQLAQLTQLYNPPSLATSNDTFSILH